MNAMKELKVRDLMTTEVVKLNPTDTIKSATIKFALENVTGAPVVDRRNHVIGMISENDILHLILKYQDWLENDITHHDLLASHMDVESADDKVAEAVKKISEMTVEKVMTRTVLSTTPDGDIVRVLKDMMRMDVNRLPVLEKGILVGIISRSDIIFSIYKRKV